jgi:hypothetical protein
MMCQSRTYYIPSDGEIILTLDGVCIQNAAKGTLRRLADDLMSDRVSGPIYESAVEILGHFLETANFGQLRANHPELRTDSKRRVRLFYTSDATVGWDLVEAK